MKRPLPVPGILTVLLAVAALAAAGCTPASDSARHAADRHPRRALTATASRPPGCTATQLRFRFGPSQPGAGNDIGGIAITNATGQPCWLTGPIRLTGLRRSGTAVTGTVTYRQVGRLVKQAGHRRPDWRGARLGRGLTALMTVWAEYRDDPAGRRGLCTAHQVEPATWRLVLASGAVIAVRNAAAGQHRGGLTPDGGLLTCRGRLNPAQPILVGPAA